MSDKRLKIGEILVKAGLIQEEQLQQALKTQNQLGGTLGENLIRLGFLSEEVLLNGLSEQMGMQHINLEKVEVPSAIQRLPPPGPPPPRGPLPPRARGGGGGGGGGGARRP